MQSDTMPNIRQLYDLQQIDAELSGQVDHLAKIENELLNDHNGGVISEELSVTNSTIEKLQLEQKSTRDETDTTKEKIGQYEEKMYSGDVVNVRELEGMQKEVELLNSSVKEHEEKLSKLLTSIETAESTKKDLDNNRALVDKEHEQRLQDLTSEQETVTKQISTLSTHRKRKAKLINPDDLVSYEKVRTQRGGVAVSSVQRGLCGVCKMSLPTHKLQRARSRREIVPCDSCGRILYIG